MKVTSKKLPKSQIELTIELSAEEMQPYLQKAAEKISKETKFSGFREGKAPLDVVIKQTGEMAVWQAATDLAINKTYYDALEQGKQQLDEKNEVIAMPEINVEKVAPNNPLVYKATVALLPGLELPNLDNIKVKPKQVEVDEKEIEKAIDTIRDMRATEALENKAVEMGDRVEVDFTVSRDNVPIDKGTSKDYSIVIGKKQMIEGFEDNLIGMKPNEEKKFQLSFPKNYHEKSLAGKPADFKVKVNKVYKRTLPEINDTFAKTLQFEKVEDLKKQVRADLEHKQQHKLDQELEHKIFDAIIEEAKFDDFPDILIDQETRKMLGELKQNIAQQGLKFEDYLQHLKKTESDLRLDFTADAIKRVKSSLIIRQIGIDNKIEADEKDLEKEINQAKVMYADRPEIMERIESKEYQQYLKNVLTNSKVISWLKEKIAGVKPHVCDHEHGNDEEHEHSEDHDHNNK